MYRTVKLLGSTNLFKLQACTKKFLSDHNLNDQNQITITSIDGDDDWFCGNGSLLTLPFPEESYNKLNKSLTNTPIARIVQEHSEFYRWRLLKLSGKQTYSVHKDAVDGQINKRIHIPIISNPDAFLIFYDKRPQDGEESLITSYHLQEGRIYEVDTSGYHTAVNYGSIDRWHLVGVRYE